MGLFVWSGPRGAWIAGGGRGRLRMGPGPIFCLAPRSEGTEARGQMGQTVDKERLIELLEPPLATLGYELADIDVHLGRRGLLRLFIDRQQGVTIEDCERVSEQIGAWLDVEDPLPGSYVLEVSSPGLDRRLRTLEHFERFAGEPVKVELKDARDDGRRRLNGRLAGVETGEVLVNVDGEILRLALRDIAVARLAPQP